MLALQKTPSSSDRVITAPHRTERGGRTISYDSFILKTMVIFSYTPSREYRVVRNRYSRLLFTSEDRFCANVHVQEQLTNMTSQC